MATYLVFRRAVIAAEQRIVDAALVSGTTMGQNMSRKINCLLLSFIVIVVFTTHDY